MPRIPLRQSGYTNSASGSFTKTKEWTQKFNDREIQDAFIKTN